VSSSAVGPGLEGSSLGPGRTQSVAAEAAKLWWLWLVTGIAWVIAALVILQFDKASVTTVGIIVGCMFLFAAAQQFVLAAVADSLRWLWAIFGTLFLICGVISFVRPEGTFAGMADILGFLFLVVGVWWTIEALLVRAATSLWWIGLICGIFMIILAFWTSGQFFIHKAYLLLVFAGVWALMHGITDIIRAFQVRAARDAL
jgi:uncharacterized membrane protein HdeD (DUF308 family)